jgi:hypothetical protein
MSSSTFRSAAWLIRPNFDPSWHTTLRDARITC